MILRIIFMGLLFMMDHPVINCQQPEYITGKVIDSKTSEPVPYAAVRLKNSQLGVISNAEGDFRLLNIPKFQTDSVIVSCIGFQRFSVAFKDLKTVGINKLRLVSSIYVLSEVRVVGKKRRLSPEIIIARALGNIKKNSPDEPFSYVSYYRDYQKDKDNYFNLNEAIIQTLDKGFAFCTHSNRYRLLDFKNNADFPRLNITPFYNLPETDHSDGSFKKIPHAFVGDQNGNELFMLLVHDAIRNFNKRSFSFIDTLNHNFLRNHKFSDPTGIYDGSTYLHRIEFSAKRLITGDSIQMKGVIFIEPDNYSIHKLEYYGSYLDSSTEEYKQIFNIEIEYGHEAALNNKMGLKFISFNNSFTIPDSSDNDFFQVVSSEWSQPGGPYARYPDPNMTFKTSFNKPIDPVSGAIKENYEMTIGKRKGKITKAWVSGNNLFITLRDDKFNRNEIDSCNLKIQNIKDINGNLINKPKDLEFHQFRELFVQEYNQPLEFRNNCFIEALSLEQNCISISENLGRFWMNTPLKSEEKNSKDY